MEGTSRKRGRPRGVVAQAVAEARRRAAQQRNARRYRVLLVLAHSQVAPTTCQLYLDRSAMEAGVRPVVAGIREKKKSHIRPVKYVQASLYRSCTSSCLAAR